MRAGVCARSVRCILGIAQHIKHIKNTHVATTTTAATTTAATTTAASVAVEDVVRWVYDTTTTADAARGSGNCGVGDGSADNAAEIVDNAQRCAVEMRVNQCN